MGKIRLRKLRKKQLGGFAGTGARNTSGSVRFNPRGIQVAPLNFSEFSRGVSENNANFQNLTRTLQVARQFNENQFQDRRDFLKEMYDKSFPTITGATTAVGADTYGLDITDPTQQAIVTSIKQKQLAAQENMLRAGVSEGKLDPSVFMEAQRTMIQELTSPEVAMYQNVNKMKEDMGAAMAKATSVKGVVGNYAGFERVEESMKLWQNADGKDKLRYYKDLEKAFAAQQLRPTISSEERGEVMKTINNYVQNPDRIWDRLLEKGEIIKTRDTSEEGIAAALTQLLATDANALGIMKSDAAARGVDLKQHISDFVISRTRNAPLSKTDASAINTGVRDIFVDSQETDNNIEEARQKATFLSADEAEKTRRKQLEIGGSGADEASVSVEGFSIPANIAERFDKDEVPIQTAASISKDFRNGLSIEDIKAKYPEVLDENDDISPAVIDFHRTATPVNQSTTSPSSVSDFNINKPFDISTFPENSGLSPSQYSILREESGGGNILVNPDDVGLPSVGPHQFRGKLGQQFLARYYPDLSERYDLSKPLTPGQTKDLQRDLQEKEELVSNSIQFMNDELSPRTYDSYDKITGVEPREQEAVILDSMAVNHSPEGQDKIIKRAEELFDSGAVGSRPEALTAARIEYIDGLDSLDDNTKLNLRERYLRELEVSNNHEEIFKKLGTPIRQEAVNNTDLDEFAEFEVK